jgi:hypothetical protein
MKVLFGLTFCALFLSGTLLAQTDYNAAKATVNTGAENWIKKNAGYTVVKDTTVALDSSESYKLDYEFKKDAAYKLAAVLSGEPSLTLQLEDIAIGAEVYAPGNKDDKGCTVAESDLTVSDTALETINVITVGGGIGMPCRYLILKKK